MSRRRKRRWDPATFTRHKEGDRTYIDTPEPMCDFCLLTEPTWEYPATAMPIEGHPLVGTVDGAWAACDECHRLVEAKDIQALVNRSIEGQRDTERPGYVVFLGDTYKMRRQLRDNILRFFDARTGPAVPFDTTTR